MLFTIILSVLIMFVVLLAVIFIATKIVIKNHNVLVNEKTGLLGSYNECEDDYEVNENISVEAEDNGIFFINTEEETLREVVEELT